MIRNAPRIAAATAALMLLSACGITAGPVRPQGRPEATGIAGTDTQRDLSRPAQIDNAALLVSAFLEAPAVADPAVRAETMKSYLLAGEIWQPGTEINVVRIIEGPTSRGTVDGTNTPVDVKIQHVGAFINGAIEPSTRSEETVTFTAVSVSGKGMYLRAPKPDLLLSDAGLARHYEARSLYFDTENNTMVPDLRYVPIHFSPERKAESLVQWLYGGASGWLRPAVRLFPAETRPHGKVSHDGKGVLTVDLAKPVNNEEYARLYRLISKTVVVDPVKGVKLTMQGQVVAPPALPAPEQEGGSPSRMAVVGGSAVRLRDGAQQVDPSVGLAPEMNKNIVVAGFSRYTPAAMLAQQEGDRLKLMIGLRPALVRIDAIANPRQVGQPVWINRGKTAMLLVDGRIYQVGLSADVTEVQGVPDGVTAMSVAPDGVRIVMLVNGALRIGALKRVGTAVSLTSTAYVPTGRLTQLHHVAFGRTSKQELFVAGIDATGVRLILMNLDGSQQEVFNRGDSWQPSLRINHLSVDPQSGRALIEIKQLGSFEAQISASVNLQDSVVTPASGAPDQQPKVSAPSFEG